MKAEESLHPDDLSKLKKVRIFSFVEFVLANLGGLALMVSCFIFPADQSESLTTAWMAFVMPSYMIGVATTVFHGNLLKRPIPSYLPEFLFWAVFPFAALALLLLM